MKPFLSFEIYTKGCSTLTSGLGISPEARVRYLTIRGICAWTPTRALIMMSFCLSMALMSLPISFLNKGELQLNPVPLLSIGPERNTRKIFIQGIGLSCCSVFISNQRNNEHLTINAGTKAYNNKTEPKDSNYLFKFQLTSTSHVVYASS